MFSLSPSVTSAGHSWWLFVVVARDSKKTHHHHHQYHYHHQHQRFLPLSKTKSGHKIILITTTTMAIITNGSPLKPSNTTASSSSSSLEVLRLSSLLPNSLPSRGFFLALFLFSISLALLYIAITWLKMNSSSKGGCSKHWLDRFYLVLKEKVSTLVLLLLATLISFVGTFSMCWFVVLSLGSIFGYLLYLIYLTVYNSRNSERHPQPPSVDAYSYDSGDEGQAATSSYCSSNATAPMLSSEPEEEKSPSPEKSHHHHQHHYNHLYPVLA